MACGHLCLPFTLGGAQGTTARVKSPVERERGPNSCLMPIARTDNVLLERIIHGIAGVAARHGALWVEHADTHTHTERQRQVRATTPHKSPASPSGAGKQTVKGAHRSIRVVTANAQNDSPLLLHRGIAAVRGGRGVGLGLHAAQTAAHRGTGLVASSYPGARFPSQYTVRPPL